MPNRKVFLIHGHDSKALDELREIVLQYGLEPIILKDKPDVGNTVIEKFEFYASKSLFAIALLTPDDKQAHELDDKFRARQNVILEMGWFMGKRTRKKLILLHKGEVELPSDITGILYISFLNDIEEVSPKLEKELIALGLLSKN